jgi:hypothetical protein
MSFQKLFSKLLITFFKLNESESSNIPKKGLDSGELTKNPKLEMRSSQQPYPDLELGFGPNIEIDCNCGDVIINMDSYENCKIFENYVSFMETINYLSCPIKDRGNPNMSLFNENKNTDNNTNKTIIVIEDEAFIDIPLYVCQKSSYVNTFV